MKAVKNKEKFVVTNKLLADPTGVKMGKTTGNMITLTDSAEEMFGKVMSWTDRMIVSGFELCTKVPMAEVKNVEKRMKAGENPRDLKLELAGAVVEIYYGRKEAETAKENFLQMFQKKEVPDDIAELKMVGATIVDVLVEAKFVTSKTDARRNVEQNGVKLNGTVVTDPAQIVKSGDIIQKGKRFFIKIK
ncbi:MAG: hypothetical protein ACD_5C00192G0001 [uncultured bacterium]|nr:MAG: hypothetical protein ACD_5C00192G0001 [uncultured bacterium]